MVGPVDWGAPEYHHEVSRFHPSTSYHGARRQWSRRPEGCVSGSCRASEPCPIDYTNGLDTLTMGPATSKEAVSRPAPRPLPLMDWTPFAPAPHPHIVILVRLGCGSEFLVSVGAGAAGQQQSLKETDTRFWREEKKEKAAGPTEKGKEGEKGRPRMTPHEEKKKMERSCGRSSLMADVTLQKRDEPVVVEPGSA